MFKSATRFLLALALAILPAIAFAAGGTIDSSVSNAAYTSQLGFGTGTVSFAVTGLTASGATLTIEASDDGGTTWASVNGVAPNTGALATTMTADGQIRVNAAGRGALRLRVSSTGSGTITVSTIASTATGLMALSAPVPGISGTVSLPTGAATAANQTATQTTAGSTKFDRTIPANSAGSSSGGASYSVIVTGYSAYTTPTDMVCLSGSASKVVTVTNLTMLVHSTSATLQPMFWIKRSTADTGGTPTTPTPVPADSADSAATAVLTYYGSAPTLGTTVGTYSMTDSVTATATATAAQPAFSNVLLQANATTFTKPPTLHGTAESLCINLAGAALPSGFTSSIVANWSEQTAP